MRLQQKKNGLAVFRLSTFYKIASSGRSRCIRAPLTTVFLLCKNTQPFCQDTTRHPCRALNERGARSSPRNLATSVKREVPRATLQRARSAKFPAQELPSVSDHKARINAALCVLIRNCSRKLSKNFSFWTASLILCATFKIKSL